MVKGLWEGHGYRASEQRTDVLKALDSALIAVDTNVLLDLYRYVSSPREDLVNALQKTGDRVFIPHQVSVEFWRGREGALNDAAIRRPEVISKLTETQESAAQALNEWANRVALDQGTRDSLTSSLSDAFMKAKDTIDKLATSERNMRVSDTTRDSILDSIVELCAGRVGDAPDDSTLKVRSKEGLRRAEAGEPPGFRDKKKEPDRVVGDYLLWCEAMDAAIARGADLVLITRDTKEDWWKIVSGEPIGPRVELLEEFWRESSGKRAFFLRPSQFVSMIAEKAGQPASETAALLARAERSQAGGAWSPSIATEFLDLLRDSYRPQYEAVKYAAEHSGRVPREKVYDLSQYEDDRTLRGFGRPVNRLARAVFDPGDVIEDFPPVFDSYYDPTVSWVQAAGFELDPDLASALRHALSPEDVEMYDDEPF